jgi:hypothetical protein
VRKDIIFVRGMNAMKGSKCHPMALLGNGERVEIVFQINVPAIMANLGT